MNIPETTPIGKINWTAALVEFDPELPGLSLRFGNPDCCSGCCHTICELDLGTIEVSMTGPGSSSYVSAPAGWLENDDSDFPNVNEYKAWLYKASAGEHCEQLILAKFGKNPVSFEESHPEYPGTYHFGPEKLIVDDHGVGSINWTQSGGGTTNGSLVRDRLAKRDPVGTYSGTADRILESIVTTEDVSVAISGPIRQIACLDVTAASTP